MRSNNYIQFSILHAYVWNGLIPTGFDKRAWRHRSPELIPCHRPFKLVQNENCLSHHPPHVISFSITVGLFQYTVFAKRKLDCCLYFINLLIWLKWLQANFKLAFPQGRDRRLWKERNNYMCQKQKEMDIDFFSAYQIYPIIYFMLSLFQLVLLDSDCYHTKVSLWIKKKASVYCTW